MPDPIAAAFKPGWRLQIAPVEGAQIALVQVMLCQEAWRRLTLRSRRALLAISEQPGATVHHHSRRCLLQHGLIDDTNTLTDAGRAVVRHRPLPNTPIQFPGRPVIDVHLPPLPAEVTP